MVNYDTIDSQAADKRKNIRVCKMCGLPLTNNKTKIGEYCKRHDLAKIRNLYIARARLHGVKCDSLDGKCSAVAINLEYNMKSIIRMHKEMIKQCKIEGKDPAEFIATHEKINQVAEAAQKLYSYMIKLKGGN